MTTTPDTRLDPCAHCAPLRAQLDEARRERERQLEDMRREHLNMRRERDDASRELVNFKARVRSRMIEEAEARDWCSEFDDILIEFGLEPRNRNWVVRFDVTGSVYVRLIARDGDHARHLAENAMRIQADHTYELNRHEVYVETVEHGATERDDD